MVFLMASQSRTTPPSARSTQGDKHTVHTNVIRPQHLQTLNLLSNRAAFHPDIGIDRRAQPGSPLVDVQHLVALSQVELGERM